jgi:hypothetical protein
VYVSPEWKKRLWIGAAVVPFLLPGWRGELVPVPHEEVLLAAKARDADDVFGVSRDGEVPGERWHAQYLGGRTAKLLDVLNLRAWATRLTPPDFAAHIPPGPEDLPERADAYFRVATTTRWPWWWPGGGVDWRLPR